VSRRYTDEGDSLGALARWLTLAGNHTRTGQPRWNKSSVWDMLRDPAYQGTACFQKTRQAERRRVNRRLRQRGGIPARPVCSRPRPREDWIEIPVPALVSPTQFALAQERFEQNRRFAARHTKQPSLLQGLLICQLCGYALYRYSTRTTRRRLTYYRCTGMDGYRFPEGRRCANRPVRQDAVEALVWEQVIHRASRRELFERLDQPALRPLSAEAFVYSEWKIGARVNIDYHIELHGHYYSVPYALVPEHVDACLTTTTVEIFHRGQRLGPSAELRPRHHTTDPAHMPKAHQRHLEWTPSRLIDWAAPSTPKLPRWSRRFSRIVAIPSRAIARASASCASPSATARRGWRPPAPAPSRSTRAPTATVFDAREKSTGYTRQE
jgi:Recombinase/Recombinase zinc beta ribbon domain/Mu transposase, C-terminal domain